MLGEKLKTEKTKRIINIIGNALTVSALGLIIYRLVHADIDYSVLLSKKNILLTAGLVLAYAFSLLMVSWSWLRVMHSLSYRQVRFRDAQKTFCKSNLMKYIPGNIMQYIGRNEIAVQLSLDHRKIAFSTILDIVANLIGIGLVSVACYGNGFSLLVQHYSIHLPLLIAICSVLLAVLLIVCFLCRRRIKEAMSKVKWREYFPCFAVYALYGFWTGGIYIIILRYIIGVELAGGFFFTVTGAFLLSWLIGFVTPGAPAGVGIREVMIVVFLNGILLEKQILLGIIIYRIVNTLGDVVAFLFCVFRDVLQKKAVKAG